VTTLTSRGFLRRARWSLLLTAVVLAAIAVVLVRGVKIDPSEVLHALAELGPGAIALAAVLVVCQGLLLMTRLWSLFPTEPRPSWPRVAYGFCVGQLVNNFIRRPGDILKVLLIAGSPPTGPSRAETVGVVVVDKLVDLAVLFSVLAWVGTGTVAFPVSLVVVIGFITLAAVAVLRQRSALVARIVAGMHSARDPRRLAAAAVMAMASWSAELAAIHYLASALGFDLGFADAVRVIVMLNLGVAIPLSAANLGTFEVAIGLGLHAAGMSFADGLAIATAYHAIQILAITLWTFVLAIVRRLAPAAFEPEAS
jgi:uncharacterized membrane protein YbhN (UPF0104 family)